MSPLLLVGILLLVMGVCARLVGRRGERDLMWLLEFVLLGGGLVTVLISFW
ncbi:hypothetical protein ACPCG0_03650 [Propionibacteriaceae bacterium Y1923]|uniref:hypothetical protein n=1 Tax=Aestuariimicrobium sp. Y1814 TaxID=3418742 RepID=UPI003C19D5A0